MDDIQKELVKAGRKDLAQKYYEKVAGKKVYYQTDNIDKVKYTISYHDGVKKHKDGSDFYDIKTFKNKKDLAKFEQELLSKGYKYKRANVIAGKSQEIKIFVEKLVETYAKQNGNDLKRTHKALQGLVNSGSIRMSNDVVTALWDAFNKRFPS